MSTTLSLSPNKVNINWSMSNVLTLGNTTNSNGFSYSQAFTNGTAANQADLLYVATGTIAASTSLNIDLSGSSLDFFGNTITMVRVKGIFVYITTDTAGGPVQVGNNANGLVNWISANTAWVSVSNGGCLYLCAPDATAYAVTAATGDILTLKNTSGTTAATYKVAIWGASA